MSYENDEDNGIYSEMGSWGDSPICVDTDDETENYDWEIRE